MSDRPSHLDLEALLSDALRPVDPPESLATRLESTLETITQQAAAELSSWADELEDTELASLRDPRNWVRPVVATAAGALAGGALLVFEARRRRQPTGLRARADELLRSTRARPR